MVHCLLCNHEDLNSDPWHSHKNRECQHTCTSVTSELESRVGGARRVPRLLASHPSQSVSSRSSESACLKKKKEKDEEQ